MKSYVIGAGGFLGKHLAIWLSQSGDVCKAPPFNLLNSSEWQETVLKELREYSPDVVLIPGAAQDTGDDFSALNSLIFSNCVLPCLIAQQLLIIAPSSKLVVFGSSWQYADADDYRPFNLYAASKQAGQDLLEHYALKGLKILQLIIFDTYGEDDSRRKITRILLDACINGDEIAVTAGDQEIDLVHIDDVCSGVEAALLELESWNSAHQGVLIRGLGSGLPIRIKDLIELIQKIIGKPLLARVGARPYRDREVMTVFRNYIRPRGWNPKHGEYHGKKNTGDQADGFSR